MLRLNFFLICFCAALGSGPVFSQGPVQSSAWLQPEGGVSRVAHEMDGLSDEITYMVTGRGLSTVASLHAMTVEEMKEKFNGKKVLDMAAGEGVFVYDMLKEGIDIMGLDVIKTKNWGQVPELKCRHLQKSMAETGEPDESYDYIMATYSIFHYYPSTDKPGRYIRHPEIQRALFQKAIQEGLRLLKPGGIYFISPVSEVVKNHLIAMVKEGNKADVEIFEPDQTQYLWALRIIKK